MKIKIAHLHTTNTVTTWSLCVNVELQCAAVKSYRRHHRLTTSPTTPQVSWPLSSEPPPTPF